MSAQCQLRAIFLDTRSRKKVHKCHMYSSVYSAHLVALDWPELLVWWPEETWPSRLCHHSFLSVLWLIVQTGATTSRPDEEIGGKLCLKITEVRSNWWIHFMAVPNVWGFWLSPIKNECIRQVSRVLLDCVSVIEPAAVVPYFGFLSLFLRCWSPHLIFYFL